MPALVIEKDVFTFDELSDEAKETARDWMRDLERMDFDGESLNECFETAAKILGIDFDSTHDGRPDIRWSGFCSQGDGASFIGSYSHEPNSPAKMRAEFPTDTRLHEIADGLSVLQMTHFLLTGHRLNAKIEQGHRGGSCCHEGTMSITVEDSHTGEEMDADIADRMLELMRDFARWIYRSLEQEYDYRLSDEAIDDALGQYTFDEDGDRVD